MNVLVVDDDESLRAVLTTELRRSGHEVAAAATGGEGFRAFHDSEPDVVLLDLALPDERGIEILQRMRQLRPNCEVIVLTAHGTVDNAIAAMKLGAYDFLQKPCPFAAVDLALQRALEHRQLGEENARLKDALHTTKLSDDLIGKGCEFESLRRFIVKVAPSDSTVLIRGETGSGKELVAAAIHQASQRSDQPFVVVDCASLHEHLLQSELFGHERGAFTGAVKTRHGLFEAGDRGTIFLDEVGDVSPPVQASLLRVLETSRFRRVGATREVVVNVRLIAATNRNLERMVSDGQFRRDLFFRLNAIHLQIPPLRQRRGDIPVLAEHFVARHNARYGTRKALSPEALERLTGYDWPGNVRELRHAVERALVLSEGEVILPPDLPAPLRSDAGGSMGALDRGAPISLAELERKHIARVLDETGGHRVRAAAILGISERHLYRKIRDLDLEPSGDGPDTDSDDDGGGI